MKSLVLTVTALLLLSGCGDRGQQPEDNATAGAAADATAAPAEGVSNATLANTSLAADGTAAVSRARFLGRWRGVEGLNLVVAPRAGAHDAVSLAMQWSLDDKGTYDGEVTPEGIAFERAGVRELLRPSDGAATGLKYLAGKKDCLTVKPGEGYCRD